MNKRISLVLIIILVISLLSVKSYAAVQGSGGSPVSYSIDTWMKTIRQMEAVGGGFGLTETLKGDLTSSSESNNLDVHMEKNSEYGAAVILSASGYGNPSKINDGETTTGNKTGIVMKLNKELVSAGNLSRTSVYVGANIKYKDAYTSTYSAKSGDAISETGGWHGSGASTWLSANVQNSASAPNAANCYSTLLRAYSGSVFSYYGFSWHNGYNTVDYPDMQWNVTWYDAAYSKTHPTRCAVVCGEGI